MSQDPNHDIILAVRESVVDLFDTMLSMEITACDEDTGIADNDEIVMVGGQSQRQRQYPRVQGHGANDDGWYAGHGNR